MPLTGSQPPAKKPQTKPTPPPKPTKSRTSGSEANKKRKAPTSSSKSGSARNADSGDVDDDDQNFRHSHSPSQRNSRGPINDASPPPSKQSKIHEDGGLEQEVGSLNPNNNSDSFPSRFMNAVCPMQFRMGLKSTPMMIQTPYGIWMFDPKL